MSAGRNKHSRDGLRKRQLKRAAIRKAEKRNARKRSQRQQFEVFMAHKAKRR